MIFAVSQEHLIDPFVFGANETSCGEMEGGFCYKEDDASHLIRTLYVTGGESLLETVERCDYRARYWNRKKA